jgi:ligand-binding sensor domain-containing protein
LVVDRRGDKWVSLVTLGDIVMGGGVGRFDGQEWTVYNKSTGLPSDYVAALSTDSRGNVWVCTMMGDLSRWDGSGWPYLPGRQGGRGDQDLGRCAEDRQGQLWFPSKAGVLVYVSNE